MTPTVTQEKWGRDRLLRFTAPDAAAADAEIERLYGLYPPAGYGTRVTRKVQHPDGQVEVTLCRYDSCD